MVITDLLLLGVNCLFYFRFDLFFGVVDENNRYRKLLDAWKESKPPPRTPEEASRLVIGTLKRHQKADVEVHLLFKSTYRDLRFIRIGFKKPS